MADWVQKQMERIHQGETGQKGGRGSGNWGHAGRPGLVGGSAAGGGLSTIGAAAGSSHEERRTASDKYRSGRGGGGGGDAKPTKVTADVGEWTGGNLPRDLTKLTERQTNDVIMFLSKKPLKELRRRQDITRAQQDVAFEKRNTAAMNNLQIMDQLLQDAVMVREFADDPDVAAWIASMQ